MTEIEMERRPKRRVWTWVILILVLAAVAIGAWLAFGRDIDVGAETGLGGDGTEEVREPVDRGPMP